MRTRKKIIADAHLRIANNLADSIQKSYKKVWATGKKQAKTRLVKYILRELKDYKKAEWESEFYESIYEGACEMYVESWQNRY